MRVSSCNDAVAPVVFLFKSAENTGAVDVDDEMGLNLGSERHKSGKNEMVIYGC